jgi:micrococcal nuclease
LKNIRGLNKYLLKFILPLFFLLLVFVLFSEGFIQDEQERDSSVQESGLVTAVYDGDTIKVRFKNEQEKKVRLIGIDAPEIENLREEVKFRAQMAKRFVFFYLYKKTVKLSYDWEREDKYGRLLAYIWTEKQGLFNKFILSEGFAEAYLFFPFKHKAEFIEAEKEARKLENGLWKKGPYPSILASEVRAHTGKLLSVKYTCSRVQTKGKFVFLHSSGEEFSALIPRENVSFFPEIDSFKGKALIVTGFLEEYKGKPQIVAFFPRQIKIEKQ